MKNEKILILGACGQIGVELTLALRQAYGNDNVIATDIRDEHPLLKGAGPYYTLNVMDAAATLALVKKENITQIYLLAALLSATGEKEPKKGVGHKYAEPAAGTGHSRSGKNKQSVLAQQYSSVWQLLRLCEHTPQQTIIEPRTVYGISKYAGELWCQYYNQRWGLDVRSLRYPGLISWKSEPGGGTTDYAVEIYYEALKAKRYNSIPICKHIPAYDVYG